MRRKDVEKQKDWAAETVFCPQLHSISFTQLHQCTGALPIQAVGGSPQSVRDHHVGRADVTPPIPIPFVAGRMGDIGWEKGT